LVPANSFSEYAPEPNQATGKKDVIWFALNDDRPLFAFAIWTEFKGDRGTKSKPVPGPHNVYGFLTTEPNAIVEPIHPKAMPVMSARIGTKSTPSANSTAFCSMRRGKKIREEGLWCVYEFT
jgi:putative SOS response-associated peptidase YedK